jgi:putative ATP-dependent endonuclease of OLD family
MVHRFSELLGTPLDAAGVAVIDYQNNGSPGIFVALARALGFPWFMFADSDPGGLGQIDQVRRRVPGAEFTARVRALPAQDLEEFLFANGFAAELAAVLGNLGVALPPPADAAHGPRVVQELRNRKGEYPARLWAELVRLQTAATRVPTFLREIIEEVVRAANG